MHGAARTLFGISIRKDDVARRTVQTISVNEPLNITHACLFTIIEEHSRYFFAATYLNSMILLVSVAKRKLVF